MDNIPAPENTTSQEKVSKKFSLIKVIVPLLLLVVLGVLGFVFKDKILDLISKRISVPTPSNQVVQEQGSEYSVFGSLANSLENYFANPDVIKDFISYDKEISGIYNLNEEYGGSQFVASFRGIEDNSLTVRLVGKDVPESFILSDDFIIFCSSELVLYDVIYADEDFNQVLIKSDNMTLEQKSNLLDIAFSVPSEVRRFQLNNYAYDGPMVLGVSSSDGGKISEVNTIRFFMKNPTICYE